jgi:hypothetical protein
MRFKLPCQIGEHKFKEIISREIKKQKIPILRTHKKRLHEIATVSKQIRQQGLPPYLVCKKLPQGLGHGIFLHPNAAPLSRGRVIAPYSGIVSISPQKEPDDSAYVFELIAKVRLSKKEQKWISKNLAYHPNRLYSVNLDALKRGNFTRYINHSTQPNVAAYYVRIPPNRFNLVPSLLQIVYFAKKKILPGEQLLVCYEDGEKSYWSSLKVKPVPITPKTFQLDPSLQVKRDGKNS